MKRRSFLHGCAGNIPGFVLMAVVFFHPASAQDVAKSQILQNKADEQDVRLRTAAVVTQVQGLIDELAANGISGDDIKVLDATKAALTNLSGPEMDRVIALLQKAGEALGTKTGQQSAVDAYAGQQGIIFQFRQILKDYAQRQAAYELPSRFKDLSDRQTETMLTSVSFARATAGKSISQLTSMQQTTEQIAQADQEAIGNETALAEEQLNKAVQDSTADDAKTMQQAQKDLQSGVLQKALSQANDDLKAGQLLKATAEQQIARDELHRIAQDLNPPANAIDALTATAANLAKLIGEQKNLLDQTHAAVEIKPRVIGLDEKQGALVDEANLLQQDTQSLSAAVAGLVKDAINPMQMSRAALGPTGGRDNLGKAAASEQDAITKLEAAQIQLQQQVADAQKAAADAAQDTVAKLQDLQTQIQTALQQQQQITNQTAQAQNNAQTQQQQSQIQQETSALQQTAQPLSLPASQALAQAASQMNQAQQDLNDPSTAANAPAAQQAAQAALAQAHQQVGQQIAQAQQQPPDPAALATAANSLQQAQANVSTAIADTSTQAGSTPPANGSQASTPPAVSSSSMANAAAALHAAAQNTQAAAATPGLPSSAAAAVHQAQAAITQGQQQAAKGDAQATANSAAAAEQSLAQAQAAVAMAQAGMPGAGEPPGPGRMPGTTPAPPGPDKPDMDGAKIVSGGSTDKGTLHDATGNGRFVTVASRDRAAIDQTQAEKRPQEYAPMIDQYMKNLADQSSSSSP